MIGSPDRIPLGDSFIDAVMDAIFAAQCPLLKRLCINLPSSVEEDEPYFRWTECPSVGARAAYPKLDSLELSSCSIFCDAVRYLRDLRTQGCEIDLNCVVMGSIVPLTPELESLMEDLHVSNDDLDAFLNDQPEELWFDFWVWGMPEEEKAVIVIKIVLSDIQRDLERDMKIDLGRLKKAMALLDGAQEGSPLVKLAIESEEWMKDAKNAIHSLEGMRAFGAYFN